MSDVEVVVHIGPGAALVLLVATSVVAAAAWAPAVRRWRGALVVTASGAFVAAAAGTGRLLLA